MPIPVPNAPVIKAVVINTTGYTNPTVKVSIGDPLDTTIRNYSYSINDSIYTELIPSQTYTMATPNPYIIIPVKGIIFGSVCKFVIKAINETGTSSSSLPYSAKVGTSTIVASGVSGTNTAPAPTVPNAPVISSVVIHSTSNTNPTVKITIVNPSDTTIRNYSYSRRSPTSTGIPIYTPLNPAQTYSIATPYLIIPVNGINFGSIYDFSIKAINDTGTSVSSSWYSARIGSATVVASVVSAPAPAVSTPVPSIPVITSIDSYSQTYTSPTVKINISNPSNSSITNYSYSINNSTTYTPLNPVQTYSTARPYLIIPVNGITNGTINSFAIKAINSSGSSVGGLFSTTVSILPKTPVISSYNSTITSVANVIPTISVTLATPPLDTAITNYSYSINNSAYTNLTSANPLSIPITGVISGTTNTFSIKSINSTGSSDAQTFSTIVTILKPVPPAPVINSINSTSLSNTNPTISVTLANPSPDLAITNYSYSINGSAYTMLSSANPLSIPVSGFNSGQNYTFAIKAINSTGTSEAQTFSSVVTIRPPAPVIISKNSTSLSNINPTMSVTLATPPSDLAITNYSYAINDSEYTMLSSANPLSISVSGFNSGQNYKFSIKAINNIGSSEAETFYSTVTILPPAPVISSYITSSLPNTNPTFSVTLAPPPSESAITNYSYAINGSEYTVSSPAQPYNAITPLSIPVSGFKSGENYTFSIKSINNAGSSIQTTFSTIVNILPPAPVINNSYITTDASGIQKIIIDLVNPLDDTIKNYSYSINGSGFDELSLAQKYSNIRPLTIPITGVISGTTNTFSIKAINNAGSSIQTTFNLPVPPATPNIASIDGVSPTKTVPTIKITLLDPLDGSITNYSYSINDNPIYTALYPANRTSILTIPITGLISRQTYKFSIKAINTRGSSGETNISTVVYIPDVPTRPTIERINNIILNTDTTFSLFYSQYPKDLTITNYSYSKDNWATYTDFTPAQFSNPLRFSVNEFTNGQNYSLSIKAINNIGTSSASDTYSFALNVLPNTVINNSNVDVLIKESDENSAIQYSTDNQTWRDITWPLYIQNSSFETSTLNVKIQSNLFLTDNNNIFKINGNNITIDGNNYNITVSNVTDFAGLIQNGTGSTTGYDNITIQNIKIGEAGSTTTVAGMGWICQSYFGHGTSNKSTISNIIQNCTSSGTIRDKSGGIIGENAGIYSTSFSVLNCSASGDMWDVQWGINAGGIIGQNAGSSATSFTVQNCSYSGGINGDGAGGIVGGDANVVSIINCSSSGTVKGGGIVGRFAGQYGGPVTITGCYSSGNIGSNGNSYAGGIVGDNAGNITVTRCFSIGKIGSHQLRSAGGIIGLNAGINGKCVNIVNCFSAGDIYAQCGGIAGNKFGIQSDKCTITNCYSIGDITGFWSGGIVGQQVGFKSTRGVDITNCFSLGSIGVNGGIIAYSPGINTDGPVSVSNCYSYAATTNNNGIIGADSGSTLIPLNCYSANNNWSDTTANTILTGINTVWQSGSPNKPYKLIGVPDILSSTVIPFIDLLTASVSIKNLIYWLSSETLSTLVANINTLSTYVTSSSLSALISAGAQIPDLIAAGAQLPNLIAAGAKLETLMAVPLSYNLSTLIANGADLTKLMAEPFNYNLQTIIANGAKLETLLALNYSSSALITNGADLAKLLALRPLSNVITAGANLVTLLSLNYDLRTLIANGADLVTLLAAPFNYDLRTIIANGADLAKLLAAPFNYNLSTLILNGANIETLLAAPFNYNLQMIIENGAKLETLLTLRSLSDVIANGGSLVTLLTLRSLSDVIANDANLETLLTLRSLSDVISNGANLETLLTLRSLPDIISNGANLATLLTLRSLSDLIANGADLARLLAPPFSYNLSTLIANGAPLATLLTLRSLSDVIANDANLETLLTLRSLSDVIANDANLATLSTLRSLPDIISNGAKLENLMAAPLSYNLSTIIANGGSLSTLMASPFNYDLSTMIANGADLETLLSTPFNYELRTIIANGADLAELLTLRSLSHVIAAGGSLVTLLTLHSLSDVITNGGSLVTLLTLRSLSDVIANGGSLATLLTLRSLSDVIANGGDLTTLYNDLMFSASSLLSNGASPISLVNAGSTMEELQGAGVTTFYTDPTYKVNYYYQNGTGNNSFAMVMSSPDASDNITIKSSITVNSVVYNVIRIALYSFGYKITGVVIPNTISVIDNNAFIYCTRLTKICFKGTVVASINSFLPVLNTSGSKLGTAYVSNNYDVVPTLDLSVVNSITRPIDYIKDAFNIEYLSSSDLEAFTLIPSIQSLKDSNKSLTDMLKIYSPDQLKAAGVTGDTPATASELLTSLSFFAPANIKLSSNITFSGTTTLTNTGNSPITLTNSGSTPIVITTNNV